MSYKKKLFENDNIYKFTSMKKSLFGFGPKGVIEVVSTSTSEIVPVVVKKWTNALHQKFKAVLIRPGEFRISSLSDTNNVLAWDFQPSSSLLIQASWNSSPGQLWEAEEIHPNSNICVIKSKADGKCLRNMGVGKQISLVPEDLRDINTHWRMEPTY